MGGFPVGEAGQVDPGGSLLSEVVTYSRGRSSSRCGVRAMHVKGDLLGVCPISACPVGMIRIMGKGVEGHGGGSTEGILISMVGQVPDLVLEHLTCSVSE